MKEKGSIIAVHATRVVHVIMYAARLYMLAPSFVAPYLTNHARSLFLDALSSTESKFFRCLFDSGFSGGAGKRSRHFPKRSIDRPLAQIDNV